MAENRTQLIFDFLQGKDTITPGLKGVDGQVSKIGSAFSGMGPIIAGVGAAIASAFAVGKLISFGKEATRLAIIQENAVNELNSALARTGQYSAQASKDFQEYASALQAASTYGDEVILKNAALIQSLGSLDQDALKGATQAALDLSAALGIDLTSASTLVGKAATGEIGSFSRFGLVIEKGATASETFANALEKINSKFGGAAAAQINTFGGATQQLTNTWGDLQEEFGNFIIKNPLVVEAIKKVNGKLSEFGKYVSDNRKELLILFNEGIVTVLRGLSSFLTFIGNMVQGLKIFKLAIVGIGNEILANLLTPAKLFYDQINKIIRLIPGLSESFGEIEIATNLYEAAAETAAEAWDQIAAELENPAPFEAASNALNKLTDEVERIGSTEVVITPKLAPLEEDSSLTQDIATWLKVDGLGAKVAKSFASGIAQGAAGAKTFIVTALSTAVDSIIPGLGQALGPIFDMLAQGPEHTKKMVREFTQAIPTIIQNLIEALPVFFEELIVGMADAIVVLADKADIIIIRFTEAMIRATPRIIWAWITYMPLVAYKLIESLIQLIPDVVWEFIGELVKGAGEFVWAIVSGAGEFVWTILEGAYTFVEEIIKGAGRFIEELVKGAGGVLGDVGGGIGSFFGGVADTIGSVFGFAKGGIPEVKSVPSGFPADQFPAALTSGELVVDRTTTNQLKSFLEGQQSDIVPALLAQILNALNRPQNIETSISINDRAFADIILDLNRRNERLTA